MYVEVQVLRDLKAYTRTNLVNIDTLNPDDNVIPFRPGWAGDGDHAVTIRCAKPTQYMYNWYSWPMMLLIDGMPMGEYRLVALLMEYSEIPSGYAQFPYRTDPAHKTLGGWHTITVRAIGNDPQLSGVYREQ